MILSPVATTGLKRPIKSSDQIFNCHKYKQKLFECILARILQSLKCDFGVKLVCFMVILRTDHSAKSCLFLYTFSLAESLLTDLFIL